MTASARTLLLSLIVVSPGAHVFAQQLPDMLGTWAFEVEGIDPHPQCGEGILKGVMDVERKITPRAYRGIVRTENAYENCEASMLSQSAVTVRVRDADTITVSYDEDGWPMHKLFLKDGIMTGTTQDGLTMRWMRDHGGADIRPSEQQLAELDAFLGQIEPQVSGSLHDFYYELISKALDRTGGLDAEEAGQVTGTMVSHMTDCMMDQVRRSALAGQIPVSQIMQGRNATLMFDPQAEEFIGDECVENAASNAGIRLR